MWEMLSQGQTGSTIFLNHSDDSSEMLPASLSQEEGIWAVPSSPPCGLWDEQPTDRQQAAGDGPGLSSVLSPRESTLAPL